METAIFHAGNAGLFFYQNGTGILIDAIYDGSNVGMSPMPQAWLTDMKQGSGLFGKTDGLLFTHLHPDHYNEELTAAYLAGTNRDITIYAPDWTRNNIQPDEIGDGMKSFRIGDVQIISRRTVHDGEPWRKDPHESYLIKMGGENFFVAGDAELFAEDAAAFGKYEYKLDAAFVNLYQLGGRSSMQCIADLDAERVILYHLPFQEDDCCYYWPMGKQAARGFSRRYGIEVEILKHMSWLDGNNPFAQDEPETVSGQKSETGKEKAVQPVIYDISQELFGSVVFPGDPVPKREQILNMADGAVCNLSVLQMCAHNGTHVDAPYHFYKDGKTIDAVSLEHFIGPAYVVEYQGTMSAADAREILKRAEAIGDGCRDRILIKGKAVVSLEAAGVFADAGILLLGNESQTVGPEDAPKEVHLRLLGAEIVLLEGIRLEKVPSGIYQLYAAPINLGGSDGAPCRAILTEWKK